jgi:hypothetical protein
MVTWLIQAMGSSPLSESLVGLTQCLPRRISGRLLSRQWNNYPFYDFSWLIWWRYLKFHWLGFRIKSNHFKFIQRLKLQRLWLDTITRVDCMMQLCTVITRTFWHCAILVDDEMSITSDDATSELRIFLLRCGRRLNIASSVATFYSRQYLRNNKFRSRRLILLNASSHIKRTIIKGWEKELLFLNLVPFSFIWRDYGKLGKTHFLKSISGTCSHLSGDPSAGD